MDCKPPLSKGASFYGYVYSTREGTWSRYCHKLNVPHVKCI